MGIHSTTKAFGILNSTKYNQQLNSKKMQNKEQL